VCASSGQEGYPSVQVPALPDFHLEGKPDVLQNLKRAGVFEFSIKHACSFVTAHAYVCMSALASSEIQH
jgi:hypothetical protein